MNRIDVHAHYLPPVYRSAATAAGHAQPDGMPALRAWDVASALETMDACAIDVALLSISSPGVYFGDDTAAQQLAREVNEAGAEAVSQHPRRFGLFASLPLPNVEAALAEIAFAFDELHADGVVLLTNYLGVYLGDPLFEPVFEELARRRAVAFLHPTSPICAACSAGPTLSYPAPMLEFMFDSTRAVTNLVLSGTLARHPGLRVIVPHAGAALPTLSDRVAGMLRLLDLPEPISAETLMASLRACYYDLAGYPVPKMLGALRAVSDTDHLLYGSDWPFTPAAGARLRASEIDGTDQLSDAERAQIMRTNAEALFPRLAGTPAS